MYRSLTRLPAPAGLLEAHDRVGENAGRRIVDEGHPLEVENGHLRIPVAADQTPRHRLDGREHQIAPQLENPDTIASFLQQAALQLAATALRAYLRGAILGAS